MSIHRSRGRVKVPQRGDRQALAGQLEHHVHPTGRTPSEPRGAFPRHIGRATRLAVIVHDADLHATFSAPLQREVARVWETPPVTSRQMPSLLPCPPRPSSDDFKSASITLLLSQLKLRQMPLFSAPVSPPFLCSNFTVKANIWKSSFRGPTSLPSDIWT